MQSADASAARLTIALVVAIVLAISYSTWYATGSLAHCKSLSEQLLLCPASDMLRLRDKQAPEFEHPNFDFSESGITLHAARNEVIAFQLIAHRLKKGTPQQLSLQLSELHSDENVFVASAKASLFQAWYHKVEKGGYSWGPASNVLPWPGNYPDALIPQFSGCQQTETVFESVSINPEAGTNTALWMDLYVPREQQPGVYKGFVKLRSPDIDDLDLPFTLHIHDVTLPDRPTVDAVGEVYQAYVLEGVGEQRDSPEWAEMAHCYQRLAHQHRLVFIERWDQPSVNNWAAYRQYAGPMLSGDLFTAANDYYGPGENTPISVWRTPWPQVFNGRITATPSASELKGFEADSMRWRQEVQANDWSSTRYFAYVFDEVDGPSGNETEDVNLSYSYILNAHRSMSEVQQAIDRGAGDVKIDLIWTSHADPRRWLDDAALNLVGTTRLWAPNADAAPSEFLQQRKKAGERVWFYHSGHPSIGIHSINASGIEMRTWGVIAARYQLDGNLMWAVNLGDMDAPYRMPVYKPADDRFGNGVMVYPGKQLPKIGFDAVPGPIPSMRLKAWRRGLQDAELAELGRRNGKQDAVEQLLTEIVPVALADAQDLGLKEAQWSQNPADWIDLKINLLQLASQHSR
ncbi:MAG: DUF4091 domain-containing protein [Pseudomonadales bacterium]